MRFLALEQPDIVHFHCVQRLTASIIEACKDAKIPYIITAHDAWWISDHQFLVDQNGKVYPQGHPDPYERPTLPEGISFEASSERRNYFEYLLKGAQHLLTVSESFAEIYKQNGYPNIAVNKNGISDSTQWKQKNTSDSDKVICGHIGNITPHKGYDILKQAVIESQPENLKFLFVDHSKPHGFRSKELWGTVEVEFIGSYPQKDIVSLYTQIDVLFAPSIWPESFGLVTREAAACGCWVVASNIGGIGEDVIQGETGYITEPNVESIKEILIKIDKDYQTYKISPAQSKNRVVKEQVDELIQNIYIYDK